MAPGLRSVPFSTSAFAKLETDTILLFRPVQTVQQTPTREALLLEMGSRIVIASLALSPPAQVLHHVRNVLQESTRQPRTGWRVLRVLGPPHRRSEAPHKPNASATQVETDLLQVLCEI